MSKTNNKFIVGTISEINKKYIITCSKPKKRVLAEKGNITSYSSPVAKIEFLNYNPQPIEQKDLNKIEKLIKHILKEFSFIGIGIITFDSTTRNLRAILKPLLANLKVVTIQEKLDDINTIDDINSACVIRDDTCDEDYFYYSGLTGGTLDYILDGVKFIGNIYNDNIKRNTRASMMAAFGLNEFGLKPSHVRVLNDVKCNEYMNIMVFGSDEVNSQTPVVIANLDNGDKINVAKVVNSTKPVKEPRRSKVLEEIIDDFLRLNEKASVEETRELIYNFAKNEGLRQSLIGDVTEENVDGELKSETFYLLQQWLLDNANVRNTLVKSAEEYAEKRHLKDLTRIVKDHLRRHRLIASKEGISEITSELKDAYSSYLKDNEGTGETVYDLSTFARDWLNAQDLDEYIGKTEESEMTVEQLDEEHDETHINPDSPWAEAMTKAKELGYGKANQE